MPSHSSSSPEPKRPVDGVARWSQNQTIESLGIWRSEGQARFSEACSSLEKFDSAPSVRAPNDVGLAHERKWVGVDNRMRPHVVEDHRPRQSHDSMPFRAIANENQV